MTRKEWRINLPSGQCPFADYMFNAGKNKTDILCRVREAQSFTDIDCREEQCVLKISEARLFEGLYLTDIEGVD